MFFAIQALTRFATCSGCTLVRDAFDKCVAKVTREGSLLVSHMKYALETLSLGSAMSVDECTLVVCFNFAAWIVHQKSRDRNFSRARRIELICDLAMDKIPVKKRKSRSA